ncbi:MAG: hypothetical protein ACOX02_04390 [Acholeplasmatales bacterium]
MKKRSRVRKHNRYVVGVNDKEHFYLGTKITNNLNELLDKLNIEDEYSVPKPDDKHLILLENIQGKELIDKTEMEEYQVEINWRRTDWHGNEHTGVSFYTRERYKRYYTTPNLVRLSKTKIDGDVYVISEKLLKSDVNNDLICFYINLFNDLFDDFIILDKDISIIVPITNKVDWEIVAPGNLIKEIERIYTGQTTKKRTRSLSYIKHLQDSNPTTITIGMQEYNGYIAFNYENNKYTIVESMLPDNATYIFNKDEWEELSKLTKQELIDDSKYVERIIHFEKSWFDSVNKYL